MTCHAKHLGLTFRLNDQQKREVRGVLSSGCDRQTAADYIGCSLSDLGRAMQADVAFAREVLRAEALLEVKHMQNVQESAKQEKNWRASVWWLERRSPERFGARGPGAITARQLKAFNGMLVEILEAEVRNQADRERVVGRLVRAVDELEQMLRDSQTHWLNLLLAEEAASQNETAIAPNDAKDAEGLWDRN